MGQDIVSGCVVMLSGQTCMYLFFSASCYWRSKKEISVWRNSWQYRTNYTGWDLYTAGNYYNHYYYCGTTTTTPMIILTETGILGSFKVTHFRVSRKPTRHFMIPHNNIGFSSKGFEDMVTEITKNRRFCQPNCRLTPPSRVPHTYPHEPYIAWK